jgi:hypothetical protein
VLKILFTCTVHIKPNTIYLPDSIWILRRRSWQVFGFRLNSNLDPTVTEAAGHRQKIRLILSNAPAFVAGWRDLLSLLSVRALAAL